MNSLPAAVTASIVAQSMKRIACVSIGQKISSDHLE
jgi:hypothetical protein